jgi:5-methylcytosine-specific restriction endonuclease McrA
VIFALVTSAASFVTGLVGSRGVVDHRIPIAAGGNATAIANAWLPCERCDADKTRDDLDAMRRHRG